MIDPRYVQARRVLLDALEALAPYRDAVILAGAQAVYVRTGLTDVGIAPFTTDGDLALDPSLLGAVSPLEEAMRSAGFELRALSSGRPEPGIWGRTVDIGGEDVVIPIDLIVPAGAASGGGRRGARLGPHGKRAARRIAGLEAVLVDHSTETIGALDPSDPRSRSVEVAGAAALLVAKAHKIHDRVAAGRASRIDDKDAADVYRLMQTTSPRDVGETFAALVEHDIAGPTTRVALEHLTELFARRNGVGVQMTARALRLAAPAAAIATLSSAFMEQVLSSAKGS